MNKKQTLFVLFLLYLATFLIVLLVGKGYDKSLYLLDYAIIALIIDGIVASILGAIVGVCFLYEWLGDE